MKTTLAPLHRFPIALAVLALGLATLGAYHAVVSSPFIFDDIPAILENQTLRHLSDFATVLSPSSANGLTVGGRPLLNLSLAFNYALSGESVWSYHVTNVVIHLLGGLTLFGIVRRSLQWPVLRLEPASAAAPLSATCALFWLLHPLQTESVTYIVQRAESLMGLFYLLTVYCFVRAAESRSRTWRMLATVACYCGMATKEVMVTAPIVILLYDRCFVSGSFALSWRNRRLFYAGLFASWVLLACLVIGAGNRGGTIGPAAGIAWWQYALCQARGLWLYLRLTVLPFPLILDYGPDFVSLYQAAPYLVVDVILIAVTAVGLWRGRPWAFLLACLLGILAPSSTVVGGTRQMLAEHRMYLSLAPAIILVVLGFYRIAIRWAWPFYGLVAQGLLAGTLARNHDYQSELSIWADTVRKRPQNPMAHGNYGVALIHAGQKSQARQEFETALALNPLYADAHDNLGNLWFEDGHPMEAIEHYRLALRAEPNHAAAHANLGYALTQVGQARDAIPHFETALRLKPYGADTHNNFAIALFQLGRSDDALRECRTALRLNPQSPQSHNTYGVILVRSRHPSEALQEFATALQLDPNYAEARRNLTQLQSLLRPAH